ncbi:hypothetical protein JMJ35_003199 [Cladonia borealis]|uniref:Uncharacterized protein n=1 Tax=Cladonia borealis TaxID=184061 RepID=A0AA39R468_9LECA|nr:hypothetical protein JMJ35_003199 [Cladonia borealis]
MASQMSPRRDDNSTPTPIVTNDHNRPISVLSTASHSPKFIPAPRSPTRSLATEIFNAQTYQRPETGTSVRTDHTFDSSYPPSIDDEGPQNTEVSRLSFISDESEEYARTPSPIPPRVPPTQSHHTRSNTIERHISKPTAVSDSLGFNSGSRGLLRTSKTKDPRSPGTSTASTIESIRDIEAGSDYQRASVLIDDDIVSNHETWPLRTPTGSPTPPRKDIHGLNSLPPKSPFIVSDVATKSSSIPDPQPVISQPSVRSPTASRFNFLPKFLRSTSAKDEPPVVPAKSPKRSPNYPKEPEPFFDDSLSDDEDPAEEEGYGYDIQDARPAMVVRSGSNTIELKEMLRSTPPVSERPGPSRAGTASRLGTHIDSDTEDSSKKEGIYIGFPRAEKGEDPNKQPDSIKSGHHGLGQWKDINPFAMSVLRSHQSLLRNDVSPAPPTPPKSAPVGRKVSFPTPAPLDIKPEHRFLRQSIVSTPYPNTGEDGKHRKGKPSISDPAHKTEHENQSNAVLTLVLYGDSNPIPKIKKIVLPHPQETQLISESENGKPPIIATQITPFDDEALSNLLHSTYNTMRGPLRYLASARTVRNLRLLSYTSIAQLASRHANPMHFHGDNVMLAEEEITEARMLDLFHKPRLGRGRNEWTSWVKGLPENVGKGSENTDGHKIAVEFVEGWAPGRLYGAVVAVLFCSILATLLWIFVGTSGQVGWQSAGSGSDVDLKGLRNGMLGAAGPQVQESPVEYKGPGGRVQAGVELGILILMLGWTAVGGWGLLSWLVT